MVKDRAILVKAAMVGYNQTPAFDVFAPEQRAMQERIEWDILHGNGPLRRAVEAEGLLDDWTGSKAKL